jgi:hypothetical protein
VAVNPGYQATAVAAFSDGSSREVTSEAQWVSSNTAVATVSPTGRVTIVSVGTTDVRATYQGITGNASLAVSQPPLVTPNYRITGTIVDALDQAPVANALVELVPDGQPAPPSVFTLSNGAYEILGSTTAASFNATMTARRDGYATRSIQRVLSGDATIDLTLDPVPFTLVGTVQDNQDRNVPTCEPTLVEAVSGPDAGRSIVVPRSPADGSYQFPNVRPGTATLRASAPGYHIRESTVRLRGYAPLNRLDFLLLRGPQGPGGTPVNCSLAPLP